MTPTIPLRRLSLGQVRPEGWLRAQMRRDLRQGFAGRLDALSGHVARDLFANRLGNGDTGAAWWDAESRGNWLWGYTMLAHLAREPEHRARSSALISQLAATQDPDGYLGIYTPAVRYRHGETENAELWAQSRALLALLAHHELTGDKFHLVAAQAAAALTMRQYDLDRPHFGRLPTQSDMTGLTHGLCYADALQWLHELTGDPCYVQFADRLLADFNRWTPPFPNDDLADANLADPRRALRGHAVHTIEHLRALAFVAGSRSPALASAWRKLSLSTTPSGALIGDESLHGLPGPGAAYEYCTLVEGAFSLARLAQVTGDAAFGDALETLVFNAAQGAREADGRALAYLCTDTRLDALATRPDSYSRLSGRHGRFKLSPTHDDVACCCNPNALRLLPHYVAAMWWARTDARGLVAMAYGPCELHTMLDEVPVTILERTGYPFEDRVHFTVQVARPVRFGIRLRRPGWANGVRVRGAEAAEHEGFLEIERHWHGSHEFSLELDLPIRAQRYPGGELAVLRGPLQFVQPIRHRRRVIGDHRQDGFHDMELAPADAMAAAWLPVLDTTRPDLGLAPVWHDRRDADDPWQDPGLSLRSVEPGPAGSRGLEWVPMGCAPLRRADFMAIQPHREEAC